MVGNEWPTDHIAAVRTAIGATIGTVHTPMGCWPFIVAVSAQRDLNGSWQTLSDSKVEIVCYILLLMMAAVCFVHAEHSRGAMQCEHVSTSGGSGDEWVPRLRLPIDSGAFMHLISEITLLTLWDEDVANMTFSTDVK